MEGKQIRGDSRRPFPDNDYALAFDVLFRRTTPEQMNQLTSRGLTPLQVFVNRGTTPLVTYLLSKGADPNTPYPNGDYPLLKAMRLGMSGVARELLKDPRTRTDIQFKNKTPLNYEEHVNVNIPAVLETKKVEEAYKKTLNRERAQEAFTRALTREVGAEAAATAKRKFPTGEGGKRKTRRAKVSSRKTRRICRRRI